MLADGQNPDALEARLAFHLHRLKLTGQPLRQALKGKAYLATVLSQGRTSVDDNFISTLATALNIAADELSRSLEGNEAREWHFYRSSAVNREHVWANVAQFATQHGLSIRGIAKIVGMKPQNVSYAISGKRSDIFTWAQAEKLATAATPPPDPATFLGVSDSHER